MRGMGVWLVGLGVVLLRLVKGVSYLKPSLLWTSPTAGSIQQTQSGGFLDPLEGTFLVTAIGTLIAAPLGVGIAVWLTEYARPAALARAVDSAIEMLAGVPSIVLPLFGLLIFSQCFLGFLAHRPPKSSLAHSFLFAAHVRSRIPLP